MTKPSWIQQVYGYAVCLVAIVTMLVSASNLVDAVFLRMNPIQASEQRYGPDENLTSFEGFRFRRNEMRSSRMAPEPKGGAVADTVPTAELRRVYDALRADRVERMGYEANQRLVKHGLLILLSIALFATHWQWLRSRSERADTAIP